MSNMIRKNHGERRHGGVHGYDSNAKAIQKRIEEQQWRKDSREEDGCCIELLIDPLCADCQARYDYYGDLDTSEMLDFPSLPD